MGEPKGSVLRRLAAAPLRQAALVPALQPGDLVGSSFLASSALFDADAVAVAVAVAVTAASFAGTVYLQQARCRAGPACQRPGELRGRRPAAVAGDIPRRARGQGQAAGGEEASEVDIMKSSARGVVMSECE